MLGRLIFKLAAATGQALVPSTSAKAAVIARGHRFWDIGCRLASLHYDLIIVEDIDMLPLAIRIRGTGRVLMDAREYYPLQREGELFFTVFQAPYRLRFCREYLPLCDAIITVSGGLAREYKRVFGVDARVVRSVPAMHALAPRKCDPDQIRLVHHGVANRNRQLGKMLDIFERLDTRYSFDMYLTGSRREIAKLIKRANGIARLRVLPPVAFDSIIPTLAAYDMGLFYVEPSTFNLKHCLPNKLFEFIQARLAVAVGPSPDMAEVVTAHGCGFVCPEFDIDAMAAMLNNLTTENINVAKLNSDKAAELLCFEQEKGVLEDVIRQLASRVERKPEIR